MVYLRPKQAHRALEAKNKEANKTCKNEEERERNNGESNKYNIEKERRRE
jgi:hypothetical protein